MKAGIIIVVDDQMIDLVICEEILNPYYDIYTIITPEQIFNILDKVIPDLILMDINMPGMNGFELIQKLQTDDRFANIPVIFITADDTIETEIKALEAGAVDVLRKPINPEIVLSHIKNQIALGRRRNELRKVNIEMYNKHKEDKEKLLTLQNAIISIVVGLIEFRDFATGKHIIKTQYYMDCLLRKMVTMSKYSEEVSKWNFNVVNISAQLHDIGKIGISDIILNKPGKLTKDEFCEIKKHVQIGIDIIDHMISVLGNIDFLVEAKTFISSHHEKWDGTGYPNHLVGTDIPLAGRILKLVDVYDALTSDRSYKKALSHEEAVKIIIEGKDTEFDPDIVDLFLEIADEFKIMIKE